MDAKEYQMNIFGEFEEPVAFNKFPIPKKVRTPTPTGYAGIPGKGPSGESCKTCKHLHKRPHTAGSYHKCSLMSHTWTGGRKTDVIVKSPACQKWEPKEQENAS
jgi:hypothetical protein